MTHHQSAHERAYDSENTIQERDTVPRRSRHRGQAEHKHYPYLYQHCTLCPTCPEVVSRPRPHHWHFTLST